MLRECGRNHNLDGGAAFAFAGIIGGADLNLYRAATFEAFDRGCEIGSRYGRFEVVVTVFLLIYTVALGAVGQRPFGVNDAGCSGSKDEVRGDLRRGSVSRTIEAERFPL